MRRLFLFILIATFVFGCSVKTNETAALVFQSDFGVKDAAVASMKGVAFGVSPNLSMHDITHEIPVFDIWEAAQRLVQTAEYWPSGTVFVSVVDPGVGTDRKSVVLKTKSGHYFVTPDNGTLTLVAEKLGIESVREIDEAVNRLRNSKNSYTFHGRDVYAFTGARLAAGIITFEQVGKELPSQVVEIKYQEAKFDNGVVYGNIPILDIQYGNIWTNIDKATFEKLQLNYGDEVRVRIMQNEGVVLKETLPFYQTFGGVAVGQPLLYLNSLNNVSLAINQGNFSEKYKVQAGSKWRIQIWK